MKLINQQYFSASQCAYFFTDLDDPLGDLLSDDEIQKPKGNKPLTTSATNPISRPHEESIKEKSALMESLFGNNASKIDTKIAMSPSKPLGGGSNDVKKNETERYFTNIVNYKSIYS